MPSLGAYLQENYFYLVPQPRKGILREQRPALGLDNLHIGGVSRHSLDGLGTGTASTGE